MTERSDVDLMLAVQAGDDAAFSVLVERHKSAVVNLTYRYLGNFADAEDLAQEVFLKVYGARARYRPEAKFTTWMYRIAVNASLNEVRNRKNRPTFRAASLVDAGQGEETAAAVADGRAAAPADEVERLELNERVRAAVDRLPERQRMALLLNKFQGLSYEELAATFDLTIQAIKSLLTRARENVRHQIAPYVEGARVESAAPGREKT